MEDYVVDVARKGMRYKVKDLIAMDIDIDVYDNVTDDGIAIAFCGPMRLTEEGKNKFREVLDYYVDIDVRDCVAIVEVTDNNGRYKERLKKAKEFFYAAAGYCDADDYDRWFLD